MLESLRSKYPDVQFNWILGAGKSKDYHKWKNLAQILRLCRLQVLDKDRMLGKKSPRTSKEVGDHVEFYAFKSNVSDISSVNARKMETSEALETQVPQGVAEYITEQGLYCFTEESYGELMTNRAPLRFKGKICDEPV